MDNKKMINRVIQVTYHRNGVGGAGFHAVLFESSTERCTTCRGFATLGESRGGTTVCTFCDISKPARVETVVHQMVGLVFDEPGHVAVLDVSLLSDPAVGVAFGKNSWRGDQYERELRKAIMDNESDGSIRVGPFAIPTARHPR